MAGHKVRNFNINFGRSIGGTGFFGSCLNSTTRSLSAWTLISDCCTGEPKSSSKPDLPMLQSFRERCADVPGAWILSGRCKAVETNRARGR
jgi:hypothetical protein